MQEDREPIDLQPTGVPASATGANATGAAPRARPVSGSPPCWRWQVGAVALGVVAGAAGDPASGDPRAAGRRAGDRAPAGGAPGGDRTRPGRRPGCRGGRAAPYPGSPEQRHGGLLPAQLVRTGGAAAARHLSREHVVGGHRVTPPPDPDVLGEALGQAAQARWDRTRTLPGRLPVMVATSATSRPATTRSSTTSAWSGGRVAIRSTRVSTGTSSSLRGRGGASGRRPGAGRW